MYRNVLAATDGSDLGTAAVNHAASIARAFNASLTIVTVAVQVPVFDGIEPGGAIPQSVFNDLRRAAVDQCSATLKKAAETAGPGARTDMIESTSAYAGILELAKKIGADLIVMGSHSRTPLGRLILGSQAAKVVSLSDVPVLIVK